MSLYEELVTKSQWNFVQYQMLYRRGQTAYELTNKPELPYDEAIDQMVAWVKDADVVVTAAWNTAPGTPESERRLRDFAGFQVTSRLMEGAKPDAMLLHCLPAHRGEEISTAVFEEHADEIFDEAENRLHVQKAVLAILLAGL